MNKIFLMLMISAVGISELDAKPCFRGIRCAPRARMSCPKAKAITPITPTAPKRSILMPLIAGTAIGHAIAQPTDKDPKADENKKEKEKPTS